MAAAAAFGCASVFFQALCNGRTDPSPATANRKALDNALGGHVLAEAEWMGRYERP